jgi:hypothetical protein
MMITKDMDAEKLIRIIQLHNYDVERLSNMSLLRDTRRVAYVLGVVRGAKPKLKLWGDIVRKVKEME